MATVNVLKRKKGIRWPVPGGSKAYLGDRGFGLRSVSIVFLCADSRVSIGSLRDMTKKDQGRGNSWK